MRVRSSKTFMAAGVAALLIGGMFLASNHCAAADDHDAATYTDPAKAGKDYQDQGEYLGDDADGTRWGAQVVALGGGKFRIVGYRGGLPGDGWQRGDQRVAAEGERVDGVVTFESPEFTTTIKDGVIRIMNAGGVTIAELKKTHRKSPTLGARPPEGATVLFDGSSADAFENGKMVMRGLLAANCSTKKKFGDHTLHIEFRTPFKPKARGQARGNSGVYVQSRYEVQVLDSFGLEGEDNECGGIYKVARPRVNMCFPPLTWQTYDIEFKAARYDANGKKTANGRITVKHNGVVIHDNLELPKHTPGRHKEGPGPDALYLQGHGNPVVYRNIWVVESATE